MGAGVRKLHTVERKRRWQPVRNVDNQEEEDVGIEVIKSETLEQIELSRSE